MAKEIERKFLVVGDAWRAWARGFEKDWRRDRESTPNLRRLLRLR